MKQTLRFDAKNVYGDILYYPANAEAMAICKVARAKTLDIHKINTLRSVFEVVVFEKVLPVGKAGCYYEH